MEQGFDQNADDGGGTSGDLGVSPARLPDGAGSIAGMGETLAPDPFTGDLVLNIPLTLPKARGNSLELALTYASSGGNGPFGIGFDIGLGAISRRTLTTPTYRDADDIFVSTSGSILTPQTQLVGGEWLDVPPTYKTQGSVQYQVYRYLEIREQFRFTIEKWVNDGDGTLHWRTYDPQGGVRIFGQSERSRVFDPADPSKVVSWLIDESVDALGNKIRYHYRAEDGVNIPDTLFNAGRDTSAQKYPDRIEFGNFHDTSGTEQFSYTVIFDYGEYDFRASNPTPLTPVRQWPCRSDVFSGYSAGFERRTYRRCASIAVAHCFPAHLGNTPVLSRVFAFDYAEGGGQSQSQLIQVLETGFQPTGKASTPWRTLPKPALALEWSHQASTTQPTRDFVPLQVQNGQDFGPLITDQPPVLLDLFGDSLNGLLSREAGGLRYFQNMGDGQFSGPVEPSMIPAVATKQDQDVLFTSVDRSGKLGVVTGAVGEQGAYANHGGGAWDQFRPFEGQSTQALLEGTQRVDVTGNGWPDLLNVSSDSLGVGLFAGAHRGYLPVSRRANQTGLPADVGESEGEGAWFAWANIFGDGRSHAVRVESARVTVWPNLGYGRFGTPVQLGGAPSFGGRVKPAHVRLHDITGTGTADLIVQSDGGFTLYPNINGNRFGAGQFVPCPGPLGADGSLLFGDVFATGTTAVIVSLPQVQGGYRHYAKDLSHGARPNIVVGYHNNLGRHVTVTWRSASRDLLRDRASGRPWATCSPYVNYVVGGIESLDLISGSLVTTKFEYRDGYFDPILYRFSGFGEVTTWRQETYSDAVSMHTADLRLASGGAPAPGPISLKKDWFLTGAFQDQGAIFDRERGGWFTTPDTPNLPPFSVEMGDLLNRDNVLAQAQSALAGRKIREELYGLDGTSQESLPYLVEQTSYQVTGLQGQGRNLYAVFTVQETTSLNLVYERDAAYPRIRQDFVLERLPSGEPMLEASLSYPRDPKVVDPTDRRNRLFANARQTAYAQGPTTTEGELHGQVWVSKLFEISDLSMQADGFIDAPSLAMQLHGALASPLMPDQPFTPGSGAQARLAEFSRQLYASPVDGKPLASGTCAVPVLDYQVQTAAFTPTQIAAAFGSVMTDKILADDGGYILDQGFWWATTDVPTYDPANYWIQTAQTDAFGAQTTALYDPYALQVVQSTDAMGKVTAFDYSYLALKPVQITDPNALVDQYLYDPLGALVVSSTHGTIDGVVVGDGDLSGYQIVDDPNIDDIVANPDKYLQDATEYFYRDPAGWNQTTGRPLVSAEIRRQTHLHGSACQLPPLLQIDYFDASGNLIQSKAQVEGAAVHSTHDKWVTSGRIVMNADQKPVRTYLPRLSDRYDFTATTSTAFNQVNYDVLHREIRTLSAKGFVTRTDYATWSNLYYDKNDLVERSPFYQAHKDDHSPSFAQELAALNKALVFKDTPTTEVFDALGQVIETAEILVSVVNSTKRTLTSTIFYDGIGREICNADARFTASNANSHANPPKPIYNETIIRGMGDVLLGSDSVDAGRTRALEDIHHNVVLEVSATDAITRTQFNLVQQPTLRTLETATAAAGGKQATEIQVWTYGDDASKNTNGRLVSLKDQAGILTQDEFDIDGNAQCQSRQALRQTGQLPDWSAGTNPPPALDPALTQRAEVTIQKAPLATVSADGTRVDYRYFANGWLAGVDLTPSGGAKQAILSSVSYDARGNRLVTSFANGAVANRTYEDSTGLLIHQTSVRVSDGQQLQDMRYTYDPERNLVSIVDGSSLLLVPRYRGADPSADYTFDSLYRIISATGRQGPNLSDDSYFYGFKGTEFVSTAAGHGGGSGGLDALVMYVQDFQWDDGNNLIKMSVAPTAPGVGYTRSMVISDVSNRAVLSTMVTGGQKPDDFYDAAGNIQSLPNVPSLAWDYRNTLLGARTLSRQSATASNVEASFLYDGDLDRVVKQSIRPSSSGVATASAFDRTTYLSNYALCQSGSISGSTPTITSQMHSTRIMDGATQLAEYRVTTQSGSQPQTQTQVRYKFTTDLQSISMELDAQAQVLSYEEYYVFGDSAFIAGPSQEAVAPKEHRYSGELRDDGLGLYYYGARYYAAFMCRWCSADPIGQADGSNLYSFVNCNPVTFRDVGGLVGQPTGGGDSGGYSPMDTVRKMVSDGNAQLVRARLGLNESGFAMPFDLLTANIFARQLGKLTGLQLSTHVTQSADAKRRILSQGIVANKLKGATPDLPAFAKDSIGRTYLNRTLFSTVFYSNQTRLGAPTPGSLFPIAKYLTPRIDLSRVVFALTPIDLIKSRFVPDEYSVVRILDAKYGALLKQKTGFSNKLQIPGAIKSLPDKGTIPSRMLVGSEEFSFGTLLKENLAEMATKEAATMLRRMGVVAVLGGVLVMRAQDRWHADDEDYHR